MRTKIIVTIGPSSSSLGIVEDMIRKGASAVRINFSHGGPDVWKRYADIVRRAEKEVGREIALIGDLSGPGLRIGTLQAPLRLADNSRVELVLAEESANAIPVPEPGFFESVEPGDIVLLDDGRITLRIEGLGRGRALARVLTGGVLSSSKSIAVRGKDLGMPPLTRKDLEDIETAARIGVDYVAVSFARSPDAVEEVRRRLRSAGSDAWVLAKIETRSGVENFESIALASDGVIVARGDLGMHYSLEEIPALQSVLVEKARLLRKPVIVATQFLESMIENPVPTRSEVIDIYNAVLSGADGLMVTAETAVGRYPSGCVDWMRRIIERAEEEYKPTRRGAAGGLPERFAQGVVALAESLKAKIAVYTRGGNTARRISSQRPLTPVYAGSADPGVRRRMSIMWGVEPMAVELHDPGDYEEGLKETYRTLLKTGKLSPGDIAVLTYGIRRGDVHTIRIVRIGGGTSVNL